jgi:undecaprenyl-phosphate galactose phosphotransferase
VREVLKAAAVLAGVEVGAAFLTKSSFSRAALLVSWCLVPCFILLLRTTVKVALLRAGGWLRPMVIIGWGENAIETALAFEGERLMGYSLLAVLVPNGRDKKLTEFVTRSGHTVPFLPLESDPDLTLKYLGEPHVVMALEQGGIDTYQHLIQDLGRRNRSIQIVPSIRGLPLYGMEVGHFFAHEVLLLSVRNNLRRPVPQLVKRAFDIVVSASLLIIGLPLFAWISLKVAASGRPIFYGHRRHGQNNQTFLCYKFRTMAPNADKLLEDLLARDADAKAEWERDFKLKNDPRITTIGRFLRRTSLDELPQLWNVLKGDMSLVGPRPVVGAELERYGSQVDYYLEAKPGITGLWQISGRNDITYDSRVYLDSWYVKNWSLFNDIVILLKTVKVIFRKDGAY